MKSKYMKLSDAQNYYKFNKKLNVVNSESQFSSNLKEIANTRNYNLFIQDNLKLKDDKKLQFNYKNTGIYNYDIINEELSDELYVDHLLFDNGRSYIKPNLDFNIAKLLRNGKWKIEATLDLHNLCIERARSAFVVFIRNCIKSNIKCVCIIHGKGYGSSPNNGPVLKNKVRSWLVQTTEIRAFSEATEYNGGSGALIVLLRKTKNES